ALWSDIAEEHLPWLQHREAANGGAGRAAQLEVAAEAMHPEPVELPPPALVVTVPPRKERKPWPDSAALEPANGVTLTRNLQRELQRVGCYSGDIDGMWTPATRSAMKAFTDRVNAALPSDQPDRILLSLVQGHQGNVCG